MQLTHYNSQFNPHAFPITLICENVTNAANVGSFFRTADAFGIEKLIFFVAAQFLGAGKCQKLREALKNMSIVNGLRILKRLL